MKYQYKIIRSNGNGIEEETLNELGDQGWELVSVKFARTMSIIVMAVFKIKV